MISIWIVPSLACHANHPVELQAVVAPGHVQSTDDDAQPSANAQHHPIHDGHHPAHIGHTANMPTTWLQVRRLCKCQSQNLQVITSKAHSTIAFKMKYDKSAAYLQASLQGNRYKEESTLPIPENAHMPQATIMPMLQIHYHANNFKSNKHAQADLPTCNNMSR
jgi:hypothetical protein